MDKEKEIEEMGLTIFRFYSSVICAECGSIDDCEKRGKPACCICDTLAERLIEEGYGNVKQVIENFAEEIEKALIETVSKDGTMIYHIKPSQIRNLVKKFCGEENKD